MTTSKSRVSLGLKAAAASTAVANLATAGLMGGTPAQAQTAGGPSLTSSPNVTINTAATFNNSWGSSFSATGDISGGSASFDAISIGLNSGIAYVQGGATFAQGQAGVGSAVAEVTGFGATSAGISISMVSLDDPTTIVLPAAVDTYAMGMVDPSGLTIGSAGAPAASFVGTNIGVEVLQGGGSLSTQVINQLSAF